MNAKLNGAKIFQDEIETVIAINGNGYIGINPSSYNAKIFNISEVSEYKITTSDSQKNTAGGIGAGAVIGGLTGALLGGILGAGGTGSYASSASKRTTMLGGLGAASGALIGGGNAPEKISSIILVFKLNNFENPIISVPLLTSSIKINSNRFNKLQAEIQCIMGTLEYLWNNKTVSLPVSNEIPIFSKDVKFHEKNWKDMFLENNLEEYCDIFEKNKLTDLDIIAELNETDLEKLGITIMGDRKKILKIISKNILSDIIPSQIINEKPSLPDTSYLETAKNLQANVNDNKTIVEKKSIIINHRYKVSAVSAVIRERPNLTSFGISKLECNEIITIIRLGEKIAGDNYWIKVWCENGIEGWCESERFEKIE